MSPALQRPHVLIVSDDPELTVFLGEGLVYAGFWTSAIASAARTDIPIFIIAASSSELDPVLAKRAGADQVILAPIELEQVAADLGHSVAAWREAHPDREWADEAALGLG